MKSEAYRTGRIGEQLAAQFLEDRGYVIRERNFRVKRGEIDLIVEKDGEIIFVEVKTRVKEIFGSGIESITLQKQRRIINTATYYLYKRKGSPCGLRFDVIAIRLNSDTNTAEKITHYVNAFSLPL